MSAQCQCCSAPLGETVTIHGARRVVCDKCLGFMTRWLSEMKDISLRAIASSAQQEEPKF